MKPIVACVFIVAASQISAGTLVPLNEDSGLSTHSPEEGLESTVETKGLSSDVKSNELRGYAPDTPTSGKSAYGGLSGFGTGDGLTGFVDDPLPEPVLSGPKKQVSPNTPEPLSFELQDLPFEFRSSSLAESEKPVIAELASIIRSVAPISITLIGHTDRRGSPETNLTLSIDRATAVRDALVQWHGIDEQLFQIVGRGEAELVSPGLTEEDHALDRRVVVVLN